LFVTCHATISDSWLVGFTDTTLVLTAGPELVLVDVLVGFCEPLEQPAHAHTATMTRTALQVRTSWDGISQGPAAICGLVKFGEVSPCGLH